MGTSRLFIYKHTMWHTSNAGKYQLHNEVRVLPAEKKSRGFVYSSVLIFPPDMIDRLSRVRHLVSSWYLQCVG